MQEILRLQNSSKILIVGEYNFLFTKALLTFVDNPKECTVACFEGRDKYIVKNSKLPCQIIRNIRMDLLENIFIEVK